MRRYGFRLCLICFMSGCAVSRQQAPAPTQVPPVYLNHLSLVLDRQTYDDILHSDFLRDQFAGFSNITTVDGEGQSWTGTYIWGEHTYIELLAPFGDFSVGDVGIGLGVEQEGRIDTIYNIFKDLFGERATKDLRRRRTGEKEIPWFYEVSVEYGDESSDFVDWVMEYHRDYLKERYPDAESGENGITRRQALLRSFKSERYLEDVYEVTVALSEKQASQFVYELRALGYKVEERGGRRECIGPDIRFVVIPRSPSAAATTGLKLRLLHAKEGQEVFRFGSKSELTLQGRQATWIF
jgi:hypothetical protein